jgi:ketosteroid isomerase-like protein
MFGDISLAGDLGYTTGPVLYTDVTDPSKPARHGIYFSVWQKQPNGEWKVVIDLGVDTPQAVAPIDTKFTAADPVQRSGKTVAGTDDYRKLDWDFWDSIAKTNAVSAYRSRLDKQFRIHRKGVMPVVDGKAVAPPVISQTKFDFIGGKIASSNDLAFTYGRYTTVNEPTGPESGYYIHVWRRDGSGKWKLVIDVQNPLPRSEN